ncbi:hydrogenase maturation peptidase HycI [Candidatus Bathyarchaeota archaeon]|nr:hydrogenase maturation peptidase HycI [Candidatus Bathyarchaeota archaeon]
MGLREDLEGWLRGCSRLVILGVGNPLRGDDALGIEFLKELRGRVPRGVKLIEGGVAPENFIGKIRALKPSHLLIIDAARFGGKPGETRLIMPEHIAGIAISTHAMPLYILAELISGGMDVKVALLGVEPKNLNLGDEISPEIEDAIKYCANLLLSVLNEVLG